jgi:hypothetical protein
MTAKIPSQEIKPPLTIIQQIACQHTAFTVMASQKVLIRTLNLRMIHKVLPIWILRECLQKKAQKMPIQASQRRMTLFLMLVDMRNNLAQLSVMIQMCLEIW